MKIMKENISIESVNHLSRCLSESLIKTLDLSNESKVFAEMKKNYLFCIF